MLEYVVHIVIFQSTKCGNVFISLKSLWNSTHQLFPLKLLTEGICLWEQVLNMSMTSLRNSQDEAWLSHEAPSILLTFFLSLGGRLGAGGSYERGWKSSPGLPGQTQKSGARRGWTHYFWWNTSTILIVNILFGHHIKKIYQSVHNSYTVFVVLPVCTATVNYK